MPSHTTSPRRDSSTSSECSDYSYHSRSTAPTDYGVEPSLATHILSLSKIRAHEKQSEPACNEQNNRRLSVDSFASTIASEEEIEEEDLTYRQPNEVQEPSIPTAYASTPSEFADYFPSTRRLCIRHDDTIDGNMNLRVDTETRTEKGRKVDLTLFHLRMQDLKRREFSFRRYCRDSGREICRSNRRYTKPAPQRRPTFHRSMSSAFASLKSRTSDKASIKSLRRQDSGYGSVKGNGESEVANDGSKPHASKNLPIPTNTTMLEFSNYAHIELRRRGTKSSKRYDFEYWGTSYHWRRTVRKQGSSQEISYHLFATNSSTPIAHIVPEPMSPFEAEEEERKGGWIPPCSMWISDSKVLNASTDIADAIVATGLMALVDDSIKNKWHRRDRFQMHLPKQFLNGQPNVDHVGPRKLIDELFTRHKGTQNKQLPLRQVTRTA